ncbi:MAG: GDSL-type esterase/lipase family protein, partial [Gammaproteobacteria bacterium]|nr:GDSL-type esterase/lipase family protein [Gammaproteobacteria bacterium]
MKSCFFKSFIFILLVIPLSVFAELPWQHDQHTRYLALGDSLTAGYGADPVTSGYAHVLYQGGAFDRPVKTLFANAAVPGVTSEDVLNFQVPQVQRFSPDVITMTVGGNDILAVLAGADPEQ